MSGTTIGILVFCALILLWWRSSANDQARRRRRAEEEAREQARREDERRRALARLEANRLRWGKVVGVRTGTCPECGKASTLKIHESGNMESHCTACGHRAEV